MRSCFNFYDNESDTRQSANRDINCVGVIINGIDVFSSTSMILRPWPIMKVYHQWQIKMCLLF